MPWLFFLAALAIPAFYAVGLLVNANDPFTITDYWRFWVVHLWVEDFLELFTTAMVAYIFVLLGVVRERVALQVIFLDIILYSAGGVIGTMHHLYFSGAPAENMALGAVFSALEVMPLTFLTVEAWSFLQLGARQESKSATPFPHRWAVMFLVAVGFWNFLGAGIFGFLINLPIVSYYEIGTALTANHGHTAMMGVYGMLAVGLAIFCLRYLIPAERWSERAAKMSFWGLNIGLAWMSFATLFPLGIRQLYESVNVGYFDARSLDYLSTNTNTVIEWLRLPGDLYFILVGVLPLLYLCYLGVRHTVKRVTLEEPEDILFTDVTEPEEPRGRPGERNRDGVPARRRLWPVPRAGSARGRRARPPLASAFGALPDRRIHLSRARRRLGLPGGRAPSSRRHRPRGSPGPLPGARPRLQCLPPKERLHRFRPRPRDFAGPGPVAALGGGALPPRDRRGDGRVRDAGDLRWRGPPSRRGGPRSARRRPCCSRRWRASTCSPTSDPRRRAFPGPRASEAARRPRGVRRTNGQ